MKLKYLLLLVILMISGYASARSKLPPVPGACSPEQGSPYNVDLNVGTFTVTDPTKNVAGASFPNALAWSNYGSGPAYICDCDGAETFTDTWTTTRALLPLSRFIGGKQYLRVNQYFDIAADVSIAYGSSGNYINVPFYQVESSTGVAHKCTESILDDTGNFGQISFYIKKPFVGTSSFNSDIFEDFVTADLNGGAPGTPRPGGLISIYHLSGTIVVPQTCQINAGQVISVDLGNMYSGEFSTKGQRPNGYTPKVVSIPVHCTNMDGVTNVQLTLTGTTDARIPDAIATSNSGVAVKIMDQNYNVIRPNSGTGMPFILDSNDDATLTLHVTPVSTTGTPPEEGAFSALAYLRVDFE